MSPWRINQIALQINRGAVIAYPTDTIWGLGCHPLNLAAVRRIQAIKQRSLKKGLILLSSSLDFLHPFIDPKTLDQHTDILARIPDRPTTWVVKASDFCPLWLTANEQTLAIRITRNPLIKQLCKAIQSPLISTSANISGQPTARNSWLIHKHFNQEIDFIIEGFDSKSHRASEIRELQSGKILRP